MEDRTRVTLIIVLVLAAIVLSCPLMCALKSLLSPRKTVAPERPKIESNATEEIEERKAVTCVQNYVTPDGVDTVLSEITAELATYRWLGQPIKPKGWYAAKWEEDKYNVGFEAKVGDETLKWRFFYYPSSGIVEPANNEAKKIWH